MSSGAVIGFAIIGGIVWAYGLALKRMSMLIYFLTLLVSGILLIMLFDETLFRNLGWDASLELTYIGLFIWIPVFAIAPIVTAFRMASRDRKMRGE